MSKITGIGIVVITAAIALLTVPIAGAQAASDPSPAPIPIQILTGKKAFISNGESTAVTGVPNLTYNAFYADMKGWGKYELVPTPAAADLILEIRFVAVTTGTNVINGSSVGSSIESQLRLAILDPKTHVVLWAFVERVAGAARQANERKNFDQAMANLVNDVKKIATTPDAPTNN